MPAQAATGQSRLVSAQESGSPGALSLEDLERIALESNPTLVQADMAVQAASGTYLQAGLYPNPTVGYLADEIGNEGRAGLQGGFVTQQIITGGKLRLGRAVASHEVAQARYAQQIQERRVLNDVRAAYYEALLAQRMVDVNDQLVRIGDEGVTTAEKLRGAEEVSRGDVLQARIEAETARLKLVEARNALGAAWRRLVAVLGRPDMEPVPLVGQIQKDLPAVDWQQALHRLWSESPELAQARAGVERAQCELARQWAMRVPNLGVGTAVKHDSASRYTVADVEVSLPLPLFERNQGRILRAQADLAAARQEVRRIELSLYDRLAGTFAQYGTSRRRVEVYASTLLPHAKEALDLVRAGYRVGESEYVSVLTAQRTYFQVNLEHLRDLRELWVRWVELDGLLLRGGLEEVKRPKSSGD